MDALVRTVGSADQEGADEQRQEFGLYLFELVARHRKEPSDNLLSRLANETSADRMEDMDLVSTGVLMLVAGHETTVNLISNGTLLMLRRPDLRERLRSEPEISLRFVEGLLRFEPPVQYIPRVAAAPIEIGGVTIPKGRGSSCCWPRRAATRTSSTIRTSSIRTARTSSTTASAVASTTASVPRWRGSKGSSH